MVVDCLTCHKLLLLSKFMVLWSDCMLQMCCCALRRKGAIRGICCKAHILKLSVYHAGPPAQPFLVRKAAAYATRILRVFGISTAAPDQLGFGGEAAATASAGEGTAKYLDAFALFRDTVRSMAKGDKSSGEMLAACDR